MDMATVEKRKYEMSEEPEEIDEFHTDRDTIMGNSTPEFVKHEGEEPGKRKGAGGGGSTFQDPTPRTSRCTGIPRTLQGFCPR
jgi:hypothetical protein